MKSFQYNEKFCQKKIVLPMNLADFTLFLPMN